jgi:hypothetical protein
MIVFVLKKCALSESAKGAFCQLIGGEGSQERLPATGTGFIKARRAGNCKGKVVPLALDGAGERRLGGETGAAVSR